MSRVYRAWNEDSSCSHASFILKLKLGVHINFVLYKELVAVLSACFIINLQKHM